MNKHSPCTPSTFSTKNLLVAAAMIASSAFLDAAEDPELTNYRSGIDLVWQGEKGTAYYEEYFFHDKLINDAKVVYIKSSTPIKMRHNERNTAFFHRVDGGNQIIGVDGRDGIADSGDEGKIRFKLDRDRQYKLKWAPNGQQSNLDRLATEYTAPFTLDQLSYEPGVPVVGTTGHNGQPRESKLDFYYRGLVGPFGDEWHIVSYADEDWFLRDWSPDNFVDQKFLASDARTVLLVVNPKTPCLTPRTSGTGQFYTTPPKAYFTPKIHSQTTYFNAGADGDVSFEIRDINENPVFYRINGQAWLSNGTPSATLSSSDFQDGENTLDYYYAGNESYVKTRTIVKNPIHPSKAEPHGNYLWKDEEGFRIAKYRALSRDPYKDYFRYYSGYNDFSALTTWDDKYRSGTKSSGPTPLKLAFVAKVRGWDYQVEEARASHGIHAKEMVLQNRRALDPVGFEFQMSGDASGNRELHAFGYYDTIPVLRALFAYDILVSDFRDDQVDGGITAVEDYFVRDCFANFAFEAMQWSADMTGLGAPGMWGGARMMGAVSIGIVMSEYSTPYYGTSGFGDVQTTYPFCPYDDDQITWKGALLKTDHPRSSYPNYTWNLGLSTLGSESLLLCDERPFYGITYPDGTWQPKSAYFSFGLMGTHLTNFANMVRNWTDEPLDPHLIAAFKRASEGTFFGARDPDPSPNGRFHLLTLINDDWPEIAANNRAWVQSLPRTDYNSAEKALQDASVWGFAQYDDGFKPIKPYDPSDLESATPPFPSEDEPLPQLDSN